MDKQQLEEREARIIDLAVAFCNEHLDEECALLCTKMAQKLGAKQDSPFQSGRVEVWAAGVVYTICSINLLFSKKYRLKISSKDISDYFNSLPVDDLLPVLKEAAGEDEALYGFLSRLLFSFFKKEK